MTDLEYQIELLRTALKDERDHLINTPLYSRSSNILAVLDQCGKEPQRDTALALMATFYGINEELPPSTNRLLEQVGRVVTALTNSSSSQPNMSNFYHEFLRLLDLKTEQLKIVQAEVQALKSKHSELEQENERLKAKIKEAEAAQDDAKSQGFLFKLNSFEFIVSEDFFGKMSEALHLDKDMTKAILAGSFLLADPFIGSAVTLGLYGETIKKAAGNLQRIQANIQGLWSQLSKKSEDTQNFLKTPLWASADGTDAYGSWAEFKYKGVVQRLRWCPAGSFLMGSPKDEKEHFEYEGPQTEITFKSGFWIFDTPVTQELYSTVVGKNPSDFKNGSDAAKRPVETVSWDDSVKFLQRLNEAVPSLSLSLPSEAQWEYACRAGTNGPRYGDNPDAIAWYDKNSKGETHPVAEKAANPWGLYDTLGNVWEWCADAWAENHKGANMAGLPRQDSSVTSIRVVRGGSWDGWALGCRAACRGGFAPDFRDDGLGFRPIQSDSK